MAKSIVSIISALAIGLFASSVFAYEKGDIILRFGPTVVAPNDDSNAVDGFPGSGVEVESSEPELGFTLTYMFNSNWGLELLAATPFSHHIEGDKTLDGIEIGSLKHLPPTLSVLYFPNNAASKFQPFVGLGVNYTYFFETEADGELEAEVGPVGLDVDDSVGLALRAGFDYAITEKLSLSAGIWLIDIDTEATVEHPTLGGLDVDVDVDPTVYMLGLSYSF